MPTLQPGQNPRATLRGHRERGPKRFDFTHEDIATATGLSLATVHANYPDLRRALAERDLATVAAFVMRRVCRASRRLSESEVQTLLGKAKMAAWANRYPRFDLWTCAFAGCTEAVFSPGLCEAHGGGKPALAFSSDRYFVVRVGTDMEPLHRVLLGFPAGDVHHEDHNKWNNRLENLKVLSHDEHWAHHQRSLAGLRRARPKHAEGDARDEAVGTVREAEPAHEVEAGGGPKDPKRRDR